jgi:protein O-GlcNAc transferase
MKYLLVKAWGYGFWADASHVLGCLLLAEITGRIPVTHWGTNSLFSAGTDDAFRRYFEPVSPLGIDDLSESSSASCFPRKWRPDNLRAENICKWDGDGSRLPAQAFIGRDETIVVSDFYLGVVDVLPLVPAGHPLHGRSVDAAYRYLIDKYLRPVSTIVARVDAFHRQYLAGPPTAAVHVRGSDKAAEMVGLDRLNAMTLDAIARLDTSWQLFLLTDDARQAALFRARFGERVVCTDSTRTSTHVGVHYDPGADRLRLGMEVMIDTYLALRCDRFLGNGASNVSAAIEQLKPWPPKACILLMRSMLREPNTFIYAMPRP